MTVARRTVVLALLVLALGAVPRGAQNAAAPTRPILTPQEMETFLKTARIVSRKTVGTGVTEPVRVTLTDGKITHDAQIQNVDISRAVFDVDPKHSELNFKDSYRYNIAAYQLATLLGFHNVPMSVLRIGDDNKPIAMTWWIDDVKFDEQGRQALKADALGPNPSRTAGYLHMLHVFDELIQNRDRNMGNLLWTTDWTMWMIDHTRAFRTGTSLLEPKKLELCERSLLTALRGLTRDAVTTAVGKSLMKIEIDSMMKRRDLIVKLFDDKIKAKGEAQVLYDQPR